MAQLHTRFLSSLISPHFYFLPTPCKTWTCFRQKPWWLTPAPAMGICLFPATPCFRRLKGSIYPDLTWPHWEKSPLLSHTEFQSTGEMNRAVLNSRHKLTAVGHVLGIVMYSAHSWMKISEPTVKVQIIARLSVFFLQYWKHNFTRGKSRLNGSLSLPHVRCQGKHD